MAGDERDSVSAPSGRGAIGIGFPTSGLYYELRVSFSQSASDASSRTAGHVLSDPQVPLLAFPARLRHGSVTLDPAMTLLVEPGGYPSARSGAVESRLANPTLVGVWNEALNAWRRVSGHSDGIRRIDDRYLAAVGDSELPRLPPLWLCRKTGRYVEPICPSCLGPMTTCRDDSLLRRCGLPTYGGSLARFLRCDRCGSRSTTQVFYTHDRKVAEKPPEGVRVRRKTALFRDLAPQIKAGVARPPDRHPCFSCEYRDECYPPNVEADAPVVAESQLVPIAYYDFGFFPVEALPLTFDEVAAFLGGASVPEAVSPGAQAGLHEEPLRDDLFRKMGAQDLQFFFRGDSTGLFPLEILYLKLSAFAQLVRGTRDLHRMAGRPHLAIVPGRIRGGLQSLPVSLPARWGLSLKLADLVTAAPLVWGNGEPTDPVAWSVPTPDPGTGASLVDGPYESLWMRLAVRESRAVVDGKNSFIELAAGLTADAYRPSAPGARDMVRLQLTQLTPDGQPIVVTGWKTGEAPGGFRFEGASTTVKPEVAQSWNPDRLPTTMMVEVEILHSLDLVHDVAGLGRLLLRLLFRNDRRGPIPLDDREVVDEIAGSIVVRRGAGSEELQARAAMREIMLKHGVSLDPALIVFRESERDAGRSAIPQALWEDVLIMALRMISFTPGWSYSHGMPGAPPVDDPLAVVMRDLEALIGRSRGALLGSIGDNRIVLEVLDDFVSDYQEALGGGSPSVPGELTRHHRLGEGAHDS